MNLTAGAVREPVTNPAEVGTLLLEFGAHFGKIIIKRGHRVIELAVRFDF